jgi:hypothetical protein
MALIAILMRRCAWCERVWTSEGWQHSPYVSEADRETSTICPDCAEALVARGQSAG